MSPFLVICKGLAFGLGLYLLRRWRASKWGVFTKAVDCSETIFVVTGATSGIGLATAKEIAARGGRLVLACRDVLQAQKIADSLTRTHKRSTVNVLQLDLSDFNSIDSFCLKCRNLLPRIDVLILNAGVGFTPFLRTRQGLELQMGVNHIGHARLTFGLMSLLKKSSSCRVVQVSSELFKNSDLPDRLTSLSGEARIEDLCHVKENYNQKVAYANSKLAGMLFMRQMSRRYQSIRWYSVSPGIVRTKLGRHRSTLFYIACFPLYIPFALLAMRTPWQGCQTVLYAALDDAIDSEYGYYRDCRPKEVPRLFMNSVLAEKLFQATQDLINRCDDIGEEQTNST